MKSSLCLHNRKQIMASENSSKDDDAKANTVTLGRDDEGSLSILSHCISSSVDYFTEKFPKGTLNLNNSEKVKQTTESPVASKGLMTSDPSIREISSNFSAQLKERRRELKSNQKEMLSNQDNMAVMKIDEVKEMLLKIMLSPNPKKTAAAELMAIDRRPRRVELLYQKFGPALQLRYR